MLDAALAEYTEHGWAGFTMDAVAKRAGVGKSTVYLRWSDKDSLLTDAVRLRSHELVAVDTGSLQGDLTALATAVFRDMCSPEGWAGFRMVMDTASAPEPLGEFSKAVSDVHRGAMATVIERARERGEHGSDVDPRAVVDVIYGSALFFALGHRLTHTEMTDAEVEARVADVVDLVLCGVTS